MIEVRRFETLEQARPFREAINALNLAATRPDPFSTFEFYENFLCREPLGAPAQSTRLWLLLAFSGEQLVGVLALKQSVQRVFGLRARRLDMLTDTRVDRPHLMTRPELATTVSAAMYAYLLNHKKDWDLLEFQQQEESSLLRSPPPAATAGGYRFLQWPNLPNGSVPIRWATTAAYFAALSKNARINVRRRLRDLMTAGEVQVLTSSDPATLAPLFELYLSIEPRSWKAGAGVGIGRSRQSLEYFAGLMDSRQPMRLVIQVLLLDGLPIAGLICGSFDRGLHALHIVHDQRFAELGPGSVILLMGMRLAIERRYGYFNLLRGFGYYKTRWLAQMTDTRCLQIYRVAAPFYWHRWLGDLWRRWRPGKTGAREEAANSSHAHGKIAPELSAEQRARNAALIAQVRSGCGEFLCAGELAAALPFAAPRKQPPLHVIPAHAGIQAAHSAVRQQLSATRLQAPEAVCQH